MKKHRIGAALYTAWGVVHILGGVTVLVSWLQRGGIGVLEALGNTDGGSTTPPALLGGIAGYHFFNIMWIGLVVAVVAIKMNWKNSRTGAWVNLALVGFADAGLVIFMLIPGYISWAEGMIGIGLFLPAAALTVIGTPDSSTPTAVRDLELRPQDA